MSTDYEPGVMLGWFFDIDFINTLAVERPESSHEEDRYDPKTGAKLDPVVVVDQEAGFYLEVDGGYPIKVEFRHIGQGNAEPIWDCGMDEHIQYHIDRFTDDVCVTACQDKDGGVYGFIIGIAMDNQSYVYASESFVLLNNNIKMREFFKITEEPKFLTYLSVQ